MKNKKGKIEILRADLIKYSKQIGIIDCEIPYLAFYGEEAREQLEPTLNKYGVHLRRGSGRYTTLYGYCSSYKRLIFVNIRGRRNLRELRNTLIHELGHYRFSHISHKDLEKRIKLILRGKEYPRKHIQYPKVPAV